MDLNKLKNKSDNFFSKALSVLGWLIMALGVIGSIILGSSTASYYDDFNVIVFLIGIFSTAISSFLILGLAEIISILNDNRRLLAAMNQTSEGSNISNDSIASSIVEELPEI